jgi:hypothetical protein
MAESKSKDLMVQVEETFMKLPPLSKSAREAIVSVTPWLALIFGVLGILSSLSLLGVLTFLSPLAILGGAAGAALNATIAGVLWIVSSALMLGAYPGLQAKKFNGWKLLFWSSVVGLASAVLSVSVGSVLMELVAMYLLFQIKSYYK